MVGGVVEEKWFKIIVTRGKVFLDTGSGGLGDENGAVFVALASHHEFATVEVDVVAVEIDEFRDAQAG